jgi:hypothetical protein
MNIKEFIGKEVISRELRKKYVITEIDGVAIVTREEKPNQYGTYATYSWKTGTAPYDNAIANGTLDFVDQTLKEPFREAYETYLHTDGRYDQYFYYSMKYD